MGLNMNVCNKMSQFEYPMREYQKALGRDKIAGFLTVERSTFRAATRQ